VTSKTAACPPPNAALLTKQLGGAGHMGGTRAGGTGLMKAQPMVQAGSMRLLPPQGGCCSRTRHSCGYGLFPRSPMLRSAHSHTNLSNPCPALASPAHQPFHLPTRGGVYSSGAAGNQAGHRVLNTKASPAQGRRGCTTPCLTPTLHASRRGHATATLTSLHWTEEGLPHATTCRRTVGVTVCHFGTGGRRAARPIKAT
jgi:hypothetical protein